MKLAQTFALLVVSASLVACAAKEEPAAAPSPTASMTQQTSGDLGKQKAAGPYQVTLMSPTGEVAPGDADFMAHVTKGGKDVEDAKVKLELTDADHEDGRTARSISSTPRERLRRHRQCHGEPLRRQGFCDRSGRQDRHRGIQFHGQVTP